MSTPAFIHLRLHSEFSIADGTVRIDDAVAAAAADAMPALALTDLANASPNIQNDWSSPNSRSSRIWLAARLIIG